MLLPLLAALLAAPQTSASTAFPFPTELHTLPNGMRVVFVPYDSPGLVAYYTLMRVGSRNEVEKGRSGFAHFFEHMMFRGTKKHSAEDYSATVTKLGLNTNASTWPDMTIYYLYGPAAALPTIIEFEADRFQNLSYDEAAFRTEAGAIRGEYDKSKSNPEMKLEEVMLETAFRHHPYAHTVIGYEKDILAMPTGYAYALDFFRRYYTPDNATVVIVGDFDKGKTLRLVEAAYGGWSARLDPVPVPREPRQSQSKRAEVRWDKPTLARLWIAWHTPGSSDLHAAAAQTLLNAYLFGPTSPLYQRLVLGRQVVDSMEATWSDSRDPSLFGVLLRVKEPKDLKAIERAVLLDVRALAGGRVDTARMEAVRSNLKYANILSLDKADALARTLALTTAPTGDIDYLDKLYAEVGRLRPADLSNFIKKYMLDKNRTTVTLVGKSQRAGAVAGGAR